MLSPRKRKKIIKLYKNGLSTPRIAKIFRVSEKCIYNVLRKANVKRRAPSESIRLLKKRAVVKPPADFPWSLREKFDKLIAVFLLTDGYIKKGIIELVCTDEILQRYFLTLIKEKFGLTPTSKSFMQRGKETFIFSKAACKELLNLSPSYLKYPLSKKNEYFDGPLPTLSFLNNEEKEVLIEAVRIAMSAEGSVTVEFQKNSFTPRLELACANPLLVEEWKEIFKKIGIDARKVYSKVTWSGIKGLQIKKIDSVKGFLEIGGFINEVKITGKSKYFKGFTKNSLLELLLQMKADSFNFLINFSTREKEEIIREMLESQEAKKKWWEVCVELPREIRKFQKERREREKIEEKLKRMRRKEEVRLSVSQFVKDCASRGIFPTWADIEKRFKICYKSYFSSILEIYKLAGVIYPRVIKRKQKKPFKSKDEGREAIKEYILKKAREGILPSRQEIENEVRVRFSSYFRSIDEAYNFANIKFIRPVLFKRAILVK